MAWEWTERSEGVRGNNRGRGGCRRARQRALEQKIHPSSRDLLHPLAHRLTYNLPAKHGFNLALSRYRTAWIAFATFAASRPRPNDRGAHPPSFFAFFVNAESLTANVSAELYPDFRDHPSGSGISFTSSWKCWEAPQILKTPILTYVFNIFMLYLLPRPFLNM